MSGTCLYTTLYHEFGHELLLGATDDCLCMCDWSPSVQESRTLKRITSRQAVTIYTDRTSPVLTEATRQLDSYFQGTLHDFNLPFLLIGTEFQLKVWNELTLIPYGRTISYSELACRCGNPRSVRAVANACRTNPIGIIIPCHRVIGADGALTGYAGGLPMKKQLIEFEKSSEIM